MSDAGGADGCQADGGRMSRRQVLRLAAAMATVATNSIATGAPQNLERAPRPLRILILGGTGFIGPQQVLYALSRGHTVTLFNRGEQKRHWPGKVEELIGDRDRGDLRSLRGRTWDACIDNPTTLPFWVRDVGTALHGHVKQYLFISTVSAYADNAAPNADESAPLATYRGADPLAETQQSFRASGGELYGPLKAASEHEALKQFPGITTIVRPGLIAGPGDQSDRFTYWPVRLARGGEVLAPGDGSDPVQLIDVRDLAQWTIRLVESRTLGAFNATGPAQPLRMDSMLASIGGALRVHPTITWVPAGFLDEQHVEAWTDLPVWVPGAGPDAGFARRNISKALEAGLTFRPLASTSIDTLAWWRQQPPERQAKMKAGLTSDREQAVLVAWKRSARIGASK